MSITVQLKQDLEIIKNIVLSLTLLTDDIDFFKNKLSTKEKSAIQEYRFFWRIYSSLYINMILYYCKLFDSEEKYSLSKFVTRAINEYKSIQWTSHISIEKLRDYHLKLCDILISDVYKNIKTARDKYYAHLDKNRPPEILIEIGDLKNLLELSQIIVNYFELAINEKEYLFSFSNTDVGHGMVGDLSKFLLLRNEIYKVVKGVNKNINYDNLRNILKN